MKGVLPMLKLFYTEFFQPNKTETQNREISISTYLCSALMVCCLFVCPCVLVLIAGEGKSLRLMMQLYIPYVSRWI